MTSGRPTGRSKSETEEARALLSTLIDDWENEVVEFKEASRQFSADKTGEYVSALSNEANLRGLPAGWLVFGISNSRQATGTTHLDEVQRRQSLKQHVQQSIDQGLTIREIHLTFRTSRAGYLGDYVSCV